MKLVYADPPYLGQCASYEHFHNDGGEMPWDGRCWDHAATHDDLHQWLMRNADAYAYSENPTNAARLHLQNPGSRLAAWTKTWRQIRAVETQYSLELVVFTESRSESRKPMVLDWLACRIAMGTGQRGAKPDTFNDWILDLVVYQPGDEFIDLFPGTHSMQRALDRFEQRLVVAPVGTQE